MRREFIVFSILLALSSSLIAGTIPANLPKPDGKPGAKGKKVKIYILAGQSNMVGFGRLSGGSPLYSWIYLSADPSVMPRNLGKGKGAILPMRVYQDAKGEEQGAKADNGAVVKLGTVSEQLPGDDGQAVVVNGFIEVPMTGIHEIHVGMNDTRYAVAKINGKEVYSRDVGAEAVITKVELEAGKRHPIKITYAKGGGSAALWMKLVDLPVQGDLTTLINDGKYTWYRDDEGEWTVRNDVIRWDVRTSKEEIGSGYPMSATANGGMLGPEIPFGFVMGEFHDEQVLIIESSMGNRALNFDFRPPSSGKTDEEKENKYCGLEYDLMVEGVHKTLKNLDKAVPGYEGQGYEIVGFVWFQGHKDSGQTKEQYEGHLVNLINDLRKEFKAPDMKAVVATVAFGGWNLGEGWTGVHAAQMAVGDPEQHPEFKGDVKSVDTRGFWRSRVESPTGTSYHYNHNAETYHLVGDALGRAMIELLGGKAEPTPGNRPKPAESGTKAVKDMSLAELADLVHSDEFASTYGPRGELEPTPEQEAAMGRAMLPIILDDMLGAYIASIKPPRKGHMSLSTILNGGGPGCSPGDGTLKCEYDEVLARYDIAGIDDYDWKRMGAIPMDSEWNYISFDPPEKQELGKSKRNRKITPPKGSEEWITAGFDAKKAGWEAAKAPFGQKDGKKIPIMPNCKNPRCGCGEEPNTMWEKEAILIQQTFEIPKLKDGHIYRLVLGGGHHDRKGEGYEIYVNGKLMATAQGGYFRHNNGARGAYITPEFLSEFQSGKVTIAVKAFLRYTHFGNGTTYFAKGDPEYYGKPVPPNGNISLFMEEAKLPEPVKVLIKTQEEKK